LTTLVIDASVALAWCFPDEANDDADAVLDALAGKSGLVPAIWALEVANALLVGERARRLGPPEIRRFTSLLENLSIFQDVLSTSQYVDHVLPLAREYGLSAYDAAYLELAIRQGTSLATLDRKLRIAAQKAGIQVFA
jgi:predicted nucleic acid-binding protein